MSISLPDVPSMPAIRSSIFAILNDDAPVLAVSPVSTAKTADDCGSAMNITPPGPNASGPADFSSTLPWVTPARGSAANELVAASAKPNTAIMN